MTREEQLVELRNAFKEGKSYKLEYDLSMWIRQSKERNCFAYALNMINVKWEKQYHSVFSLLGYVKGDNESFTLDEVERVYDQILKEIVGTFYECSFETPVESGFYKILMIIQEHDIHWMRRDEDGTWSHKKGWYYLPKNIDTNGNKILNPKDIIDDELFRNGKILKTRYLMIER